MSPLRFFIILIIGINDVFAQNQLFDAVEKGDFEQVKKIIKSGFDVNYIVYHDHSNGECNHYENRTALFWAVIRNNYDIAKYLLKQKANPNIKLETFARHTFINSMNVNNL